MHPRTFRAMKYPHEATVWDDSPFRGRCGRIIGKDLSAGTVEVGFADGAVHVAPFRAVALGDNSQFAEARAS